MNSNVIPLALVLVLAFLAIASCVGVEAGRIGARAGNAIERSVAATDTDTVRGLFGKGDGDGR